MTTTTAATTDAWREYLTALRFLAAKVAQVHGPTHPDVAILAEVVNTLAATPAADIAALAALGHRLDALTDGFRPWPGSCASVQRLYAGLKAVAAALPPPPAT